jgi:hypothetical protein
MKNGATRIVTAVDTAVTWNMAIASDVLVR